MTSSDDEPPPSPESPDTPSGSGADLPVSSVAHYRLLERVESTPTADLYRARDTRLGRTVTVHLLHPALVADPERRRAILERAGRMASLSHPGVLALFASGEEQGRVYLVYEHVAGELLSRASAGGPLTVRKALEVGIQVADALAEAHAEGLVHGDVRLDTIYLTQKERTKLLGFGMAAVLAGQPPPVGPPDGDADRIDILALGRALYEMLTGRPAPDAGDGPVRPPTTLNALIPSELDPIVVRALARDDSRYLAVATLAAELRSVAAVLDMRTTTGEVESFADAGGGGRWAAPLLVGLMIVVGLGVAYRWGGGADLWGRWFGPRPPATAVVMPFDAQGAASVTLADGISEGVMMRLGTVGVEVRQRASLRQRRAADPMAAARDADAAVVVTGRVDLEGDQLALDVQLRDGVTGRTIWEDRFASTRVRALATEAAVARAVAGRLAVTEVARNPEQDLRGAQARADSRVVNVIAHEAYLRGRDLEARGDPRGAATLYRQATDLDGGMTEAFGALALARYRDFVRSGYTTGVDSWQDVRQAGENALTLDPAWPGAHLAAAVGAPTFADATRSAVRAAALDPSWSQPYLILAELLTTVAPDEARGLYEAAAARDPRDPDVAAGLARLAVDAARPEDAARELARGRALAAGLPVWENIEAYMDLVSGRWSEAADRLGEADAGAAPANVILRAAALAAEGRLNDARAVVEALGPVEASSCEARALHAGLLLDTGRAGAGARAVRDLRDEIGVPAPTRPGAIRCQLVVAAAAADAVQTAALLRQIAANRSGLRAWDLPQGGVSGRVPLARGWYPWNRARRFDGVPDAIAVLEAAYGQVRGDVVPLLAPLGLGEQP